MQHLKELDIVISLEFALWMTNNINIADIDWFTDESNETVVFGERETSVLEWETITWRQGDSLGSSQFCWCHWAIFFETGGYVKTVNSDGYLHLLKNKFIPVLRRRSLYPADIYFQQDGATPHTSGQVLGWLQKTFGHKLISFRTDCVWPPHSFDLSPLDFFSVGISIR